jgi:hypothetical protein
LASLAAAYFLVDVVFLRFAKSLANWIAKHWIFETLRGWILSLSPYPTLGLFALPVVILEPVKPMAAYLVGVGRATTGLILLAVGEILKLALVERLFSVSRDVEVSDAMKAASFLAGIVGKAHARQMDVVTRKSWSNELNRHRSKSLEAPSWLWTSVVALVGAHEIAYLEHCRKHATNVIA